MRESLGDIKQFCKNNSTNFILMSMFLFMFGAAVASNTNAGGGNDAAFKNGYDWINSVIHGNLGTLFAAIAFIIGLIIGIAKQAPMAVVGGIIFALLIAFGPDMATGIVNSSLII